MQMIRGIINRWIFVLIWLTCCTVALSSQNSVGNIAFHELSQSQGLTDLQNTYISIDSKGFIWIGGYNGLNRYDGRQVKIYSPLLLNGQIDCNISSQVFEDSRKNLWFSTYNGLYKIDPVRDQPELIGLRSLLEKNLSDYYAFHLDKRECLWLIADDSVRIYNLRSGKDSTLFGLRSYSCQALTNTKGEVTALVVPLLDETGGIEVVRFQTGGPLIRTPYFSGADLPGFPQAKILFVKAEGDTILWLPTEFGLIRFPLQTPNAFQIYHAESAGRSVGFWDVAIWQDKILATSFGEGITVFDRNGHVLDRFSKAWDGRQNLDISKLNNVLVTSNGDIWVSSWGKGIYYGSLKHTKFHQLTDPVLFGQPIDDIIAGQGGQTTCFAHDKGLYMLDNNLHVNSQWDNIPLAEGRVSTNGVNKIFSDKQGGLWIQIKGNLYVMDRSSDYFRWIGKNLDGQSTILQVAPDRFIILALTRIFEISKGTKRVIDFKKNKALKTGERFYKCFWDEMNILLVSDGFDKLDIYEIENKGIRLIKEITGMGYVNGAAFSAKSNVFWLATNRGLFTLSKPDFSLSNIKDRQNLLSRSFNAILQDDHQNLWLSSNAGLFKYNPTTGEVKHYTESDGLQGLQFMPGSACKLSDGRLAFGGVNGLNIFHPDSVRDNPNPPIVHFTDWIVNDTGSISPSPEYLPKQKFSYNYRTLSFHFVGIDYTAPEEVTYRYRLAGYEKDTVEGGTNGFARYAQLPAGDYTFQVWAANSDGVWTTSPHELHFTILPPWYATWWARSLEWMLALGLLYAFYQNRVAQIRRKEAARRKEAEFRQKEAEGKQLAAELQNSVLRLQMNPHFIFNSMNSISSYILQKDVDTANDYLHRFAKLMRLILELASKPLIPIAEEIELLEQYMEAEAMRFENKFTWQIEVDEALDPEEVLLPTMILQPFVENAIWHGLTGKGASGHIFIGFKKQHDFMICSVEDNGVGRQKAVPKSNGEHISKALQITEQRLQLIEQKGFPKTGLKIIDRFDINGLPSGTRVEIILPLDL